MNTNILKKSCRESVPHPLCYITNSVGTVTVAVLSALVVQVIMLCVTKSFQSLVIVLCATAASVLSEFLYGLVREKFSYSWITSCIQGILLGLLVPSQYPPAAVFVTALAVFFITKYAFGGFAGSWVNSVALCVIVLYFMNADLFPAFILGAEDFQVRNAAQTLISGGSVSILPCDSSVTAFLNRTVFRLMGISIPEGYVSLFWDNGASIPAFRFNLITLISSIVLLSLDVVNYEIPLCFLAVYALLVRFVSPFFTGCAPMQGDMLLAFLTSGTLFYSLFMLQWYGTVPMTKAGRITYGIISGLFGFLLLGPGTSSSGFMFVILVMNLISTVIQFAEDAAVKKYVNKNLIPAMEEPNV